MKSIYYLRYSGYGLFTCFYLITSLIFGKIFFPMSRLIRLPYFIRVKGDIFLGRGFTSGRSLRIDVHKGATLIISENVELNDNCQIACAHKISIGINVLIASKVFISDHDHDFKDEGNPKDWALSSREVRIESGCWIGNNVSILKGVTLGAGCIVGAGSVVTKSFPSGSIIAGVPAKLIKYR
jgi:lipopolysaccharide O-acetyltransferase